MRKTAVFLFALCLCFALAGAVLPAAAQSGPHPETIAAVVNEDAVSMSDLADRLRLVIASSGMPDNPDIRARMRPQILNILIEERLKLQEAARLELAVTQEEIAQGFASIAGQNNLEPEHFRALLRREGVDARTLEDQIRAEIAWSRVIQTRLRPQVVISDNEVDAVIARLRASQGKDEYLVSEIFLPVDNPADEADVRKLADRLTGQLQEGRVPFPRLAGQFSQAAGASKGGDMGWVQEGQLPDPLDRQLARMGQGELSPPVRSLTGYHILLLRGKRTISETSLPAAEEIMQKLGMERLERLQRRYLMDLKTQAFIENRV